MQSRDGGDGDRADPDRIADGDLLDRPSESRRRAAQPARDEERCRAAQPAQGRRVEMIGMGVRDEDRVERPDLGQVGRRPVAAERAKPVAQQGIGEEADSVELDEQRRVAEVGDADAAVRLLSRRRSSEVRAVRASRPASDRTWSAACGSA